MKIARIAISLIAAIMLALTLTTTAGAVDSGDDPLNPGDDWFFDPIWYARG